MTPPVPSTTTVRKSLVGLKLLFVLCLCQLLSLSRLTSEAQEDDWRSEILHDTVPSALRGKISPISIDSSQNTTQSSFRRISTNLAKTLLAKANASDMTASEEPIGNTRHESSLQKQVDEKPLEQYVMDLVVSLQGSLSSRNTGETNQCRGFLVRDDIILTTQACSNGVSSVNVTGYGTREIASRIQSPISLGHSDGLLLLKLVLPKFDRNAGPEYHENSGWPRLRMFLSASRQQREEMGTTSQGHSDFEFTTHQDNFTFHITCDSTTHRPVLTAFDHPRGAESPMIVPINILQGGTAAYSFQRTISLMLQDRVDWNDTVAEMVDVEKGERWWVRKEPAEVFAESVQEWMQRYSQKPSNSLSVGNGLGIEAVLKLEDPSGGRNQKCLRQYYISWITGNPFSQEPFYQWLDYGSGRYYEHPECPRRHLNDGAMKYLTDTERSQARIDYAVSDGGKTVKVSFTESGETLKTGHYIFVRGRDKRLYVSEEVRHRLGHDSFFTGQPVLFAGEMIVCNNGTLLGLNSQSGHYRPTWKHTLAFFTDLKNDGFDAEAVVWPNSTYDELGSWKRVFGKALMLQDVNMTERCKGEDPLQLPAHVTAQDANETSRSLQG